MFSHVMSYYIISYNNCIKQPFSAFYCRFWYNLSAHHLSFHLSISISKAHLFFLRLVLPSISFFLFSFMIFYPQFWLHSFLLCMHISVHTIVLTSHHTISIDFKQFLVLQLTIYRTQHFSELSVRYFVKKASTRGRGSWILDSMDGEDIPLAMYTHRHTYTYRHTHTYSYVYLINNQSDLFSKKYS